MNDHMLITTLVNTSLLLVGTTYRLYDKISWKIGFFLYFKTYLFVCIGAYAIIKIMNIDQQKFVNLAKLIDTKEFEKYMSMELNEIFHNLEEGIVQVANDTIIFSNQVFDNILNSINIESNHESILDIKMFKLFRSDD